MGTDHISFSLGQKREKRYIFPLTSIIKIFIFHVFALGKSYTIGSIATRSDAELVDAACILLLTTRRAGGRVCRLERFKFGPHPKRTVPCRFVVRPRLARDPNSRPAKHPPSFHAKDGENNLPSTERVSDKSCFPRPFRDSEIRDSAMQRVGNDRVRLGASRVSFDKSRSTIT